MVPAELDAAIESLREVYDAPELTPAGPPRRMTGGYWAEVWEVGLDGRHLDQQSGDAERGAPASVVLPVSPDPTLGAWEAIVQRGVAEMGYPTPRILALGTADEDRRAWSVMELAQGVSMLDGLSGWQALVRLPHLTRALPDSLAAYAAKLHRLDPTSVATELESTGRGVGVDPMLDVFEARASALGDPVLDHALTRLRSGRREDRQLALCHGDLHPFNLLDDRGTVTVLDWTSSQIADPSYDLAYTVLLMRHPPLEVSPVLAPVVGAASRRLARRFLRSYSTAAARRIAERDLPPVDLDHLDWAMRLHVVRVLLDVREWLDAGPTHPRYGHPWTSMHSTLRGLLSRDRLDP